MIDFLESPEEVEVLTFPPGSVLRLRHIRHSATYTCRVANGNRQTDTQVGEHTSGQRSGSGGWGQRLGSEVRVRG